MTKRFTQDEVEEVLYLYENSPLSAQEIADRFGRTRNSIIGLANRHGVTFWDGKEETA
jgi:transposase